MPGAMDREEGLSVTAGEGETIHTEAGHKGLLRGQELSRYIIVDELGSGGMGIVYSAFDPDLDRKVAIKVLRKKQDKVARSRLLLEAQAMAKLSHPNVVTVFEVDTDGGRDFIAMEFVDGQNLADWGHDCHSAETVLSVYIQAGRGLAAAHQAGVIHRDFKPHNVLIGKEGRVRVTDFGLAYRATSEEDVLPASLDDSPAMTHSGRVAGTPAYMAPEQYLGASTDSRSDQFSFCVALYEALAGKRPFEEAPTSERKTHLRSYKLAPELPESIALPGSVGAALVRGLSQDRESRFESMDALLDALEIKRSARAGRRLAIGAGLVAVAATGMAFYLGASRSHNGTECKADSGILAGSWDTQVQANVRSAFVRTTGPGAIEVYDKFAAILDSQAQKIVDMRLSICEASRVSKEMNDEVLVMRMSCLQKRKDELGAVTTAFSNVDLSGIDRAVDVARGLRDVADCSDVAALERGVDRPSLSHRDEVLSLQTRLEKAISQGEAGHVKEAIVRAEEAREDSLAIGYKPLQAEAYYALGKLYGMDLRIREAELSYEEAILAAEESEHTEYRARALTGITQLIAGGSSRFKEARRYARRARAAARQWGRAPELEVDITIALAGILIKEGEVLQAQAMSEETLAHYRTQKNKQALYISKLLHQISVTNVLLGSSREALLLAQSSYEFVRDELGESNIRTVSRLSNVVAIRRMLGEYEKARKGDKILLAHWSSGEAQTLLEEDEEYSKDSRDVHGKVVDISAKPVADATVVCGESLSADSRYLDAGWSLYGDAVRRKRVVLTDSSGMFSCIGTTTNKLVVGAEDMRLGRSAPLSLAAGKDVVRDLVLNLTPTGFLSGTVSPSLGPKHVRTVSIIYADSEISNPSFGATTFVQSDDSYSFERLAPGRYKIFSGSSQNTSSSRVRFKEIEVVSGRGAVADFEAAAGDSGIRLTVQASGGAPLHSAQVLVVSGHVSAKTGKEFNRLVASDGLRLRNVFYSEGETLLIDQLQAGLYSVCLIPIGGDYRDPEHAKYFTPEVVERIPVYCEDITLSEETVVESKRTVPPWTPDLSIEKASDTKPDSD